LAGDGISDFFRIKIMRTDCVGPQGDGCGSSPRELGDEESDTFESLGCGSKIWVGAEEFPLRTPRCLWSSSGRTSSG